MQQHPSFSFHIEGGDPAASPAVPANVLIQVLQRAQQAFDLIGMYVEGREVRQRARVPAATSKRFQLVCELPTQGSYCMPVTLGAEPDLADFPILVRAYGIFHDVVAAVPLHMPESIASLLPDLSIRRRVLDAIRGMCPRADDRWRLTLHDSEDVPFAALDSGAARFVDEMVTPPEQREAARVVTGQLKSIDFAEHKVTLIYPPTSRELACFYREDIEELLYECRRDFIQVTGQVLLDDAGEPRQIIDVTDIRELDLSPIMLDVIDTAPLCLRAVPPLMLEPNQDESRQLLCVAEPSIGLDVFAASREYLLLEIREQLAMLWQEFARAPDDELTAKARMLKNALRSRFSEVARATQTA
jgi:hypothetical protein